MCRCPLTRNAQALEQWLLDLDEYEYVVIDTRNTDYAHAGSAVGTLRRRAAQLGWHLRAQELGPHKAVAELTHRGM